MAAAGGVVTEALIREGEALLRELAADDRAGRTRQALTVLLGDFHHARGEHHRSLQHYLQATALRPAVGADDPILRDKLARARTYAFRQTITEVAVGVLVFVNLLALALRPWRGMQHVPVKALAPVLAIWTLLAGAIVLFALLVVKGSSHYPMEREWIVMLGAATFAPLVTVWMLVAGLAGARSRRLRQMVWLAPVMGIILGAAVFAVFLHLTNHYAAFSPSSSGIGTTVTLFLRGFSVMSMLAAAVAGLILARVFHKGSAAEGHEPIN